MKAICTSRVFRTFDNNRLFVVEKGEIIQYTVKDGKFIINDVAIQPATFFAHFKVTEGEEKMNYSDFEYVLCNHVFASAVLFPNEYSGVRHLIIQNWNHSTIMITVNKEENIIRVSFENRQEIYTSYEEALDGIRNH